jgi:hypothetical protein
MRSGPSVLRLVKTPAIRPDFRGQDPIGALSGCVEAVERLHSRLRETKGVESINLFGFSLLPWLRGLDLNQRPLGYEPFPNRDWSQRATNNAS